MTRLIQPAALEKTLASKAIRLVVSPGRVLRSVGVQDARQISLELTDAGVAMVLRASAVQVPGGPEGPSFAQPVPHCRRWPP